MNAEQSHTTQAVNDSEGKNNYPTDNPLAQTIQNGATASGQETENVSESSSAEQRREERMKKFDIEFKTKMRLEHVGFEKRKLEQEMQMKELESKHQLLEEERELERKVKMSVPNQLVLETSHSSTEPQRREMSPTGPVESTAFYHQVDQQLASK